MKKVLFASLMGLFLTPAVSLFAQSEVFISKDVLKTAEWASFKYKDVVKKAITGDRDAVQKLFDFSRYVDGVEALDHAVTCLELIPRATDRKIAEGIIHLQPKLKKVILDRAVLAQGRTKKVELQQPMKAWAPITWDVLNGLPLPELPEDPTAKAQKLRHKDSVEDQPGGLQLKPVSTAPADDRSKQ